MARLDDPLDREFDPRTAKVLASSLGVRTVGELLRHYPRRYEQRGELTDLASLRDGEHVTVLAQISKVTTRAMRNRRGKLTEVTVTDGRGTLTSDPSTVPIPRPDKKYPAQASGTWNR